MANVSLIPRPVTVDEQAPSGLRLVGMLAALVLLLTGVIAAVALSAGAAVHRSLEPKTTADGSVCKPLSGDCIRLSRSAIETRFSVRLPAGAQLEASGSRSLIKSYEAWAVLRRGHVGLLRVLQGLVSRCERAPTT